VNSAVLSPNHLTTREAPAMAALLLAGKVCTLLPVPLQGESRDAVAEALEHAPRYRRLLNNWLTLAPLFDTGVITTIADADDPVAQVRAAADRIGSEAPWHPLRPFNRQEIFSDTEQYLDTFAADLLKGGPDPGIALPACAGLDAFAVEHALPVFRAGHAARPVAGGARSVNVDGGSLAQQVEARLGEQLFSVGLPILKQAGARALISARAALKQQLSALRNAVEAATFHPTAASARETRAAGAAYGAAFKQVMAGRLNKDDEGGRRLTSAFVSLAARRLSPDAALISSVAAFNRASGEAARPLTGLAESGPDSSLVTLTVTVLDVEPL